MKNTIQEELKGVLFFVGAIWAVFFVGVISPFNVNSYGVTPRTPAGMVGILFMPFLHGSLGHLLSNTLPLIMLLILLAGSRACSWKIVIQVVLLSGLLLWLFGLPSRTHVGASGLIFGLIAFLLVSGFREHRTVPLLIALVVGFLYGGSLVSGVIPKFGSRVSWEGHLWGAIAGGAIGFLATRTVGRNSERVGSRQ